MTTGTAIEVLTPPGRGAVAVVRCEGSITALDGHASAGPLCLAVDGKPFHERPVDRITFARWGVEHPEDVVVCRTAPEEFEIHCHGGMAAVERICRDLRTRFDGGQDRNDRSPKEPSSSDLITAAWQAVTRATTLRTADLLLHQAAVAWPALLENAQGDPEGAPVPRSPADFEEALRWAQFGQHLTEPWVVALCGRPNAGKSSLMNALAGFQRSIVNPLPGTTRDAVTMDVAFNGWPVRLVDTAGLRESDDELETAGIDVARRVIAKADLVLHIVDATADDGAVIEGAMRVLNKADLLPARPDRAAETLVVSALTGAGIDEFIARIVERLVPNHPPPRLAIPVCPSHTLFLRRLCRIQSDERIPDQ